jgi:hypothetical protein
MGSGLRALAFEFMTRVYDVYGEGQAFDFLAFSRQPESDRRFCRHGARGHAGGAVSVRRVWLVRSLSNTKRKGLTPCPDAKRKGLTPMTRTDPIRAEAFPAWR